MATTKITSNILAANAAQDNLNAGSSITLTKALNLSGNLTVDTNTLFVDSVNNRVGIGTNNPLTPLYVAGRIQTNSDVLAQIVNLTTTSDTYIKLSTASDNKEAFIDLTSSKLHIQARSIPIWFETDNSFTVPKMVIDTGGNVGIGTITPLAKIHSFATTEQLRLGYDASNYFSTTVSSTGSVTFDAVGASAGFAFNDPVTATAQPSLSSMGSTHVITKGVADIGYGQKTYHTINTTSSTILASYDELFTRSLPIGKYRFEYRVWVKNNEVSASISPRISVTRTSGTISMDGVRENRYNQGSFVSSCFRNAISVNHDGGNLTVGTPNFAEGCMAIFGFIDVTVDAVVFFRFTHNGSAPTIPTTVEGHLVLESITSS